MAPTIILPNVKGIGATTRFVAKYGRLADHGVAK